MSTLPPVPGPEQPEHDEAFARVRAADPVAGAPAPDVAALRAAVDARLAADAQADGAVVVPADELVARRARRTWLPVAAAAAGALVLGTGGGVAIGAGLGSGSDSGGATVADGALATDEGLAAPGLGREGVGGAPMPGPSSAAQGESAAGADRMMSYWGYGRTDFTASGLSDQAGWAAAYGLDARAAFTAETVARVAAALGVSGDPVEQDGTWSVGSTDGTGPNVWMYADGTGSISYYNPSADPWFCSDTSVAPDTKSSTSAGSTGSGEAVPLPAPVCDGTTRDLGTAPQGADLENAMRSAMGSIGVDPSGYEVEADPNNSDPAWSYVTAYQVVDGVRTGLSWSGSWTGAGLQSLYGSLATLVSLGDYPVISPAAAVDRLNDPRFGSGGGPLLYADDAVRGDTGVVAPDQTTTPTVPPVADPGSPISWPVAHVTIVSAELTLSPQYSADGTVVIAPTYQLTGDDGSVWSVIAVADSALDFS